MDDIYVIQDGMPAGETAFWNMYLAFEQYSGAELDSRLGINR